MLTLPFKMPSRLTTFLTFSTGASGTSTGGVTTVGAVGVVVSAGGGVTGGVVTGAAGTTGTAGVTSATVGGGLVAGEAVVPGLTGVGVATMAGAGVRSSRCAATKPKALVGVSIFSHSPLLSIWLTVAPFSSRPTTLKFSPGPPRRFN